MLRLTGRRWMPRVVSLVVAVTIAPGGTVLAQAAPGGPTDAPPGVIPGVKIGGSPNVHLVGHMPLGGFARVMDDEIEQDPDRPYAYVYTGRERPGFTIIDLHDLNNVARAVHAGTLKTVHCTRQCSAAWTASTSSRRPLLLRAVTAVRAGHTGRRPGRGRRRCHRSAGHDQDQDRCADPRCSRTRRLPQHVHRTGTPTATRTS